ncbi:hypothetical protein Tco_0649545 [Tanacetum coccineum]
MKDLGSAKQILGMSIIRSKTNGTLKATLCFSRKEIVLEGFSDSDYGGCLNSGKSTMGYVFTVSGIVVSWMSRIQKCVVMSTSEAEYMAIVEADKELSAIIRKESSVHGRTEHIKIKILPTSENRFNDSSGGADHAVQIEWDMWSSDSRTCCRSVRAGQLRRPKSQSRFNDSSSGADHAVQIEWDRIQLSKTCCHQFDGQVTQRL